MKIVLSITVAALALLSSCVTAKKHTIVQNAAVTCPPGTNCSVSRAAAISQSATIVENTTEVHNHYQIRNPLEGVIDIQVGVGQPRRCLPQRVYYPQRQYHARRVYRGAIIAPENRPCPPRQSRGWNANPSGWGRRW